MLSYALIAALTIRQHGAVPYHTVLTTEAKSPQLAGAVLIQTKRKAFEFFYLVKSGSPKPESIKRLNWRKSNVLIIYPGLIQEDAHVKVGSISRSGHTLHVTIDTHRGTSSETHYPIIVLTIDKQASGTQTALLDLGKMTSRRTRHAFGG